jgi:pre-mRNA-splicing helicase BRR2
MSVISRTYPEEKEELWWVVVGEKKSNRVLTTKRMTVKGSNESVLEFERIENVDQYIVYALCDSYMGCDQAQDINVENGSAE